MTDQNKVNKNSLKNGRRINFKKLAVDIICEWEGCCFTSTNIKEVQDHVICHLRSVYNTNTASNELNPIEMVCRICYDNLSADLSSVRHSYYHVYHFNLKSRGRHIKEVYNLPDCLLDKGSSNVVPPLTHPFICQWNGCDHINDNISDFYDHVDDHPFYEGDPEKSIFECKWSDCTYSTVTAHRLLIHMAIHCEKRYIACPSCGLCFATTSKFVDHLKRQIVSIWNKEMQEKEMKTVLSTLANTYHPVIPLPKPIIEPPPEAFKCNLCMRLFATKQMLKNHETRHIATLVCPHCNISCSSLYALKRHILFRHTEEKPFKCNECGQAFKCNDVLRRHAQQLHFNKNFNSDLRCDAQDCSFLAKNKLALSIHKSRMHCKMQTIVTKVYVCHKCDQEYVKGSLLTVHLSKNHGIKRTSNRYRHQYKICEDGKYRLNMFDLKLKTAVKENKSIFNTLSVDSFTHEEIHYQNNLLSSDLGNWKKELFVSQDCTTNNMGEIHESDIVDEILDVNDSDCSY